MASSLVCLTSSPVRSSRYVVLNEMQMSMKKIKSIIPFSTVKGVVLKTAGSKATSKGI